MANQPQHTPKGQINYNTGATPPKSVVTKQTQNLKRIKHNAKLGKHNEGIRGQ